MERQRAAIRQRPGFIEAHNSLARAYAALGRKQEAEAELAQIRTMQPASPGDEAPYLSRLFQGSLLEGKPPHDW